MRNNHTPSGDRSAARSSTVAASPKTPSPFSFKTVKQLATGRMPGQLIIQYTDKCNATCPQCEMRKQNDFARTTLNVDTGKRLIDSAVEKGVEALSFTGGEPMMAKDDIVQLIQYASTAGIKYIRTGTNGFMLMGSDTPKWESRVRSLCEQLAETNLYTFWISIDSVDPAVHEDMRGLPGVMAGMEKAIPIFREYGIYPTANLGINRNAGGDWRRLLPERSPEAFSAAEVYDYFRSAFGRFYRRAADMGFTIVNMCYPMSMDPTPEDQARTSSGNNNGKSTSLAVYAATSTDRIVRFRKEEKVPLFESLLDTVPEHRSRIRIFTPLTTLLSLVRQYKGEEAHLEGCRGGIDFFFVNSAEGDAFPCGYRGDENMGKYWDLDIKRVDKSRHCTDCDWECFRDPSEMFGPLLNLTRKPFGVTSRMLKDRAWRKLWVQDMRYYRACGLFHGRQAPNWKRLAKFAKKYEPTTTPMRYEASAAMA